MKSATGLHARPASVLVGEASKFECEVIVDKGGTRVNAKSIFGILSLGAVTGDEILVSTEGVDEEKAIESMQKLFDEGL